MEERLLGRTGLRVPRLGVGCGAVGGLMVRGDAKEQSLAVAQALEAGVRYFDTAPSYGDGRSEENLGRALAAVDTNRSALVGTKVHLSAEHPDEVRSAIRRSLRDSCRRLGRDHVDLFQLHNQLRDPFDGAHRLGEVAAAMQEAVDDGLAGHIGFTGLGDTPAIRGALRAGAFETMQTYFNAVNPSAVYPDATGAGQDFDGLVTTAREQQVGVINIRVYAAGALSAVQARHPIAGSMGGDPLAGSGYLEDVERAVRLSALAAELGLDGALELGLRCALGEPGISVVLVGLSSLDHLQAALRWEGRPPLPAGVIDRVVALARS
jgi:aryl-alcohol dehydrogenase-like predicted oxidoreductase